MAKEEIEKLSCGKCGSTTLEYIDIKLYITKEIGFKSLIFGGRKKATYFAAYRCLICNRSAFYEMPYYRENNQKSTTKDNTFELDNTQNT